MAGAMPRRWRYIVTPNRMPGAYRTFLTHSDTVPGLTSKTRLMAATVTPWPYISMAGSLTGSE